MNTVLTKKAILHDAILSIRIMCDVENSLGDSRRISAHCYGIILFLFHLDIIRNDQIRLLSKIVNKKLGL